MSSTTITTVAGAALGALVLTACGTTQAADVSDTGHAPQEAVIYAGDPWEKRLQKQFWSGEHLHDSWNRCHVGEQSGSGGGQVGPFGSLQEAQAC